MQVLFKKSYDFISSEHALRPEGSRKMIKIPEELKGFLVVYTTEDFDTFILDAITSEGIISFKQASEGKSERLLESEISAVAYTP